jgi:protein-disulfide isomerase
VRDTYPQIVSEYIDTGKVRYAVMDFPLRNHPHAFKASEAAVCAGDQNKFWEMHDLLFTNQQALDAPKLPGYAAQLGLDRAAFEKCLEDGKKTQVDSDLAAARKAGVSATPTFLIGWIDADGKVKIEQQLRGAQPYASFQRLLNQLLAKGPQAKPAAAPAG